MRVFVIQITLHAGKPCQVISNLCVIFSSSLVNKRLLDHIIFHKIKLQVHSSDSNRGL